MEDLSGQEIRGYVLRQRIGTGGFAVVYRAYQPAVDREVAVKIILPRYANDPDFVRRFEREAQMIARLEHLHIVPLYDYWREPDNAYLVMRWLRGGTLIASLHTYGPWPPLKAGRLLDQIASALMAAHRGGVIHQDLTPANILLDDEDNAYLADFGIARDIVRARDEEAGRIYGSPAYIAPERIRKEPVSPQTDIYSLGIVLYELLTGNLPFEAPTQTTLISKHLHEPVPPLQVFSPDLPDALNGIILRATAKVPEDRFPSALAMANAFRDTLQLAAHFGVTLSRASSEIVDMAEPPPHTLPLEIAGTLELVEPSNPYKGLRAFDEADAPDFFGRDILVNRLVARLAEHRFLAVVGPSGSGKSSVVRAGLIPALRAGALPGSVDWFIARMVPGADPFNELEAALRGVAFDGAADLGERLRAGIGGLLAVCQTILPDDKTELVLVIDQLEEVFTLSDDEDTRVLFLASLFAAVSDSRSRLRVVVTLRADFYDRPLLYPGFGELIRERTEVVLPLASDELLDVVIEPARRVGIALEEGLASTIVADVAAQPGALPLLQYALTELFERRIDFTLTQSAYRESGGVLGALARRAEELYAGMQPDHQAITQQLFLRLVNIGDNTRRRVRWAEVISIGPADTVRAVLDALGRYRLLTFDRDPQTREPTVEIAHEALIGQWERLRDWLADNRAALHIHRQLNSLTAEWLAAGQNPSFLASGARLAQFETLTGSVALNDDERAYLEASITQRRLAARRRRLAVSALVALTLISLVLAGAALILQNRAEDARAEAVSERDRADLQADISRSRELAALALNNQDSLDRALLLSLSALDMADTVEARGSLLTSLVAAPYLSTFYHGAAVPVRALAYSPDGRTLAAGTYDGTLILWDTETRHTIEPVLAVPDGRVNGLAYRPDGRLLAAGYDDGTLRLWDITSGELVWEPLTAHAEGVWGLAFSPDGARLASGGADGVVRLWDVESGEPVGEPLEGHTDYVNSVAFSPDGRLVASASADTTVRLWDVESGEPVGEPLAGHTNWVWTVAFSPDGQRLASGGYDNVILLWDVESGERVGEPLTGHTGWVRCVAFNADGSRLVSGSWDRTVRLWDVTTGQTLGTPLTAHRDAVWSVAFHPDGHTLASAGGEDLRVLIWDTDIPDHLSQVLGAHEEPVLGLAFDPGGRMVASVSGSPSGGGIDNTIRLWNIGGAPGLAVLHGHVNSVSGVVYSPDGSRLVTASYDGTLRFWDVEAGIAVGDPLTGHTNPVTSLAISPDGTVIASGDEGGQLRLWDGDTGQGIASLDARDSVFALAFSPDGALLASGSRSATVTLWDATTHQPSGDPLTGHTDAVQSLAFSPDGALLVSGSRDNTIIVWDVATRAPVHPPLAGHTNWVLGLAVSSDGRWLASGSRDTTIRLWSVESGIPVEPPLTGHTDWVTGVAFSPDGTRLVSGSWDLTVRLWDVSLDSWRDHACALANRTLTPAEEAQYFRDQPHSPPCAE